MDEREVERVGARTRRALSSLDDIAVPSLSQIRDPLRPRSPWRVALLRVGAGIAVVIATLVVSAGLNAWRAPRSENAGATPTPSVAETVSVSGLSRYLDIDGYRFTATVLNDPRYRSAATASAPAYVSAVPGVGLDCAYERTGPAVAQFYDAWGTTDEISNLGGNPLLQTGMRGAAARGIPEAAVRGSVATMVCGANDVNGGHGIVVTLALTPGRAVATLAVTRWSGVPGDDAAIRPCTIAPQGDRLIAAFTSTARAVADWVEGVNEPTPVPPATAVPHPVNTAFRAMAPATPIYVCYFSGAWNPPVGPPGPGQTERPITYDRGLFFVDAGGKQIPPSKIGPSSQIPLIRPGGGRF